MKLEELITLYLNDLRARGRSPRFSEHQRHYLQTFHAFCARIGFVYVDQLKFKHIVAYAGSLQNFRDITRYQMIGTIRRWLKWAHYRGHLLVNPAAEWQPRHPAHGPLRPVPTVIQMEALLKAPPKDTPQGQRDQVLLEFLYGTGVRVQECAQVTVLDLNLRDCTVIVHGKGGRLRYQPLGPQLVQKLKIYLEEVRPLLTSPDKTMALFPHDRGGSLKDHAIARRLREYSQKIGKTQFSVHSIRHAFATHLLLSGAPLWAVQKLLGHEVLTSTATYTRMLAMDVQAEVMLTHPRAKARPRNGKSD